MIREKRKCNHYTQQQMANLLGISLRQYVRIDKEEDLPRRDILSKLIAVLELTDEEIGLYIKNIIQEKVS
ncbi:MAG: helix-turn-helix transcriptional regulator [Clostridia bacterium]